jgi:hypothetical protein
MGLSGRPRDYLSFRCSARQDGRPWVMLVFGAIFVFAAFATDPQKNCSADGECAPWLVPIAFLIGAGLGLSGLSWLLANPNRGCHIDPESGNLIWWQNRYGNKGGDEGSIDPMQISLIRIDRQRESVDEVHIYDRAGTRQFYFDEEVIAGNLLRWADAMIARWPHIRLEVLN